MGIQDEVQRYREIVTRRDRDDLEDFIQVFNISRDGSIQLPMVNLPEFEYTNNPGMILQGDPRPGEDGVPDDGELIPKDDGEGEGEGGDEAGEGSGEHGMMDLEPEEIEAILEEEYDLEFDPGGEEKSVSETEGDMTDRADTGTYKDFKAIFKGALKKEIALGFDDEYIEEAIKVDGFDTQDVYEWTRRNNMPVSLTDIEHIAEELEKELDEEGLNQWESIEHMEENVEEESAAHRIKRKNIDRFYEDDEEYLIPEVDEEEEEESSAVIFNYRDVSGSVGDWDREMISTLFAPMDEYLRTKYDNVRFVYVAHDGEAWEVERPEFYQLNSGGGTTTSSALELIESMVEGEFDEFLDENGETLRGIGQEAQERIIEDKHRDIWNEGYDEEWDKYYFGAGDGGNRPGDMDKMTELVQELPGRKHLHAEINSTTSNKMNKFRNNVEDYDHVVAPGPIYEKDDIPDVWRAVFNDD